MRPCLAIEENKGSPASWHGCLVKAFRYVAISWVLEYLSDKLKKDIFSPILLLPYVTRKNRLDFPRVSWRNDCTTTKAVSAPLFQKLRALLPGEAGFSFAQYLPGQ